jgi:hypothetical protein
MILSDLMLHLKNVVPKNECQEYIKEFEKRKFAAEFEASLNTNTETIEKSNFKVISLSESYEKYNSLIEIMNYGLQKWIDHLQKFDSFNIAYYKKRLLFPHKVRLLKYSKNCYIHPHTDYDMFEHASVTINLNDDYEGGQFCFFNKKYNLNLGIGDILIFPADPFWVHEVSTITSGTRYSINSFICPHSPEIRDQLKSFRTLSTSPVFKYE